MDYALNPDDTTNPFSVWLYANLKPMIKEFIQERKKEFPELEEDYVPEALYNTCKLFRDWCQNKYRKI